MTARLNQKYICMPILRPFNWRSLGILVLLYFSGNLAVIPLLQATNTPIEPVEFWLLATGISAILIGIGLFLASRIGLGAPLIEGYLGKAEIQDWLCTVIAISILIAIVGSLIALMLPGSFNPNPEQYPDRWRLILASIKAGIVEELFYRLILVSLFAWLGSRLSRSADGRPSQTVFWIAVILAGLLFGWAHIDDKLSLPGATFAALTSIFSLNAAFGIVFGWLFWKFGLECAMLTHFLIDVIFSAVVVPAYLSKNLVVWIVIVCGFILFVLISWRVLTRTGST
jgi:membrane protease YdiL (CAAX protease family)